MVVGRGGARSGVYCHHPPVSWPKIALSIFGPNLGQATQRHQPVLNNSYFPSARGPTARETNLMVELQLEFNPFALHGVEIPSQFIV